MSRCACSAESRTRLRALRSCCGRSAFRRNWPTGARRSSAADSASAWPLPARSPAALLCDEVTSALDVSAQAQIVRLLASLRAGLGLAIVFVSHDLALVSSLCDRAMVLQGGRCVEQGAANALITNPQEPYTRRLRESVLTLDALRERERKA